MRLSYSSLNFSYVENCRFDVGLKWLYIVGSQSIDSNKWRYCQVISSGHFAIMTNLAIFSVIYAISIDVTTEEFLIVLRLIVVDEFNSATKKDAFDALGLTYSQEPRLSRGWQPCKCTSQKGNTSFFFPARACTCIDLSTTRFRQNLGAAELNFTNLGIIQNILASARHGLWLSTLIC